ncbi:hypothetical protein PR003_g13559 [Phytophthora rubi]|uniref:Uncharacterized protein n=1 Tax=Phytophthora rubi TaxID=129364 RepID=A0A6A4F1U6_9STRA|nr:hypothetical protein PR002_g12998 [Phytophthora rubi]KAE9023900.1 hypothetical protein PR001_g12805 [Phytophthora rubi]KAE9334364.1 hypothetical protein PR003_g13559 [Phytophthora rubi]
MARERRDVRGRCRCATARSERLRPHPLKVRVLRAPPAGGVLPERGGALAKSYAQVSGVKAGPETKLFWRKKKLQPHRAHDQNCCQHDQRAIKVLESMIPAPINQQAKDPLQ